MDLEKILQSACLKHLNFCFSPMAVSRKMENRKMSIEVTWQSTIETRGGLVMMSWLGQALTQIFLIRKSWVINGLHSHHQFITVIPIFNNQCEFYTYAHIVPFSACRWLSCKGPIFTKHKVTKI